MPDTQGYRVLQPPQQSHDLLSPTYRTNAYCLLILKDGHEVLQHNFGEWNETLGVMQLLAVPSGCMGFPILLKLNELYESCIVLKRSPVVTGRVANLYRFQKTGSEIPWKSEDKSSCSFEPGGGLPHQNTLFGEFKKNKHDCSKYSITHHKYNLDEKAGDNT